MQICSNKRFSWSILGKMLCSFANELQQTSNASSREEHIPQNIDCFVIDLSRLYIVLTFVAGNNG